MKSRKTPGKPEAMARRTMMMTALALALAAGGCSKKPAGQVIATVDGIEITRRDLIAELQAAGGKSADDLKTLQPRLVESIVNRKLLIEEAKRQNLTQNPQYLMTQQRLQEVLLSRMLVSSWKGKPETPSDGVAQAFIAKNPQMFGQRKAFLADEIATSTSSITSAQLANFHTNDEIAAWLKANKKPFQRNRKSIDTAQLTPELATNLSSRVGGEPLAIRDGDRFSIAAILAVREAAVPENQQLRLAKAALLEKAVLDDTTTRIKQLRAAADIKYLPGFAPASDPAPTAPPPLQ